MIRDEGPFPQADRFPAARDGPQFELEAIGRTLDDLSPAEQRKPPQAVRSRLMWAGAALVALMAFMRWLLVSR
jgi:hypothetical protein